MARLEVRVDQWVQEKLKKSDLPIYEENDLPINILEALRKASKSGDGAGTPDFVTIPPTNSDICVVIENKWGKENLVNYTKSGNLSYSTKTINDYAVNGAIHYAQKLIENDAYSEVIAIGVAGDGRVDTTVNQWFYVFDDVEEPKLIGEDIQGFRLLSEGSFLEFYEEIKLSDEDRHEILSKSYKELRRTSKKLNELFNDRSIPVDQRVIYVAGMLLAMDHGLEPDDLKGQSAIGVNSDSKVIYREIEEFLNQRNIDKRKKDMMLASFRTILSDSDRDVVRKLEIETRGKNKDYYTPQMSITKEIFVYIYDNVYKVIDEKQHMDTLGEMYSEFLSYALGDGKDNGIVLTPHYITKLMNQLVGIDRESRILDVCTGSGGFLVTAMNMMLEDNREWADINSITDEDYDESVENIKRQLLGIENDSKMFTLASSNMILRGDGSSQILKGDAFQITNEKEVEEFKANCAVLNPPFSYSENGMPFVEISLDNIERNGKLAVIIQDSAGSGKAVHTNKEILKKHTLLYSIKMSTDLFEPAASVQTSIYVFEAGNPHDYKRTVRFVDFRNDGYKRTSRAVYERDNPSEKYNQILEVVFYGEKIDDIPFVDAFITEEGNDWNYDQHQIIETVPEEEDFHRTIGDYLTFNLNQFISEEVSNLGDKNEEI